METGQIILYSFIAVLFIAMMIYFIFFDRDANDYASAWVSIEENKIKSTDILEKQMDREMNKSFKMDIVPLFDDKEMESNFESLSSELNKSNQESSKSDSVEL